VYNRLFAAQLVVPVSITPRTRPYPRWYNENAYCEYHAGAQGHSIEDCLSFKRKVQHLINRGVVKVEQASGPNVAANPLPNHTELTVNAVIDNKVCLTKRNIGEVKIPMDHVWQALVRVGIISKAHHLEEQWAEYLCKYCAQEHSLQNCPSFRDLVQGMMDRFEIEFYQEPRDAIESDINVLEKGEPSSNQESILSSLMSMRKREHESFWEYASRWKGLAARLEPLLSERQMMVRFIGTLEPPYYEEMMTSDVKNFSDVVILCGMMDQVKIMDLANRITPNDKGKGMLIKGKPSNRPPSPTNAIKPPFLQDCKRIMNIEEVRTPMSSVWRVLIQAGLLNGVENPEEECDKFCNFHTVFGHTVQT